MKSFFPFTDYDSYAYLSVGLLILFAIDRAFWNSSLMHFKWNVMSAALAVGFAYGTGQIIASASQVVLEEWIVGHLFGSPTSLLMCMGPLRRRRPPKFLFGRYFRPLPEALRERIMAAVAAQLQVNNPNTLSPEDVFLCAFNYARKSTDTAVRLDGFRNQYGFCRNMAVAAVIAAVLIGGSDYYYGRSGSVALVSILLIFALGMVVRYVKFYSSFTGEALRAMAS